MSAIHGLLLRKSGRTLVQASLLLLVFVPINVLYSQSNFGSISGHVRDASGGAIPGVTIRILDIGTNSSVSVISNEEGTFRATSLRPVTYDLTAELKGFKTAVIKGLKVDTSSDTSVSVTLQVGDLSDTVNVSAEAPLLQTESGTMTKNVEQRVISDLPLNGRNTLALALTLPGASGDAGSEYANSGGSNAEVIAGRELNINGGRPGSTQFYADGVNVTSLALGRTAVSFTPDTIQEFTVLESNYSAQYSQAGGAIIQQTTKTGTNDFHGGAFWYHRQKALTANPFNATRPAAFNYDARPPLRRQQLGAYGGGPVKIPGLYDGKDRTWFFASYEPTRQLVSDLTLQYVRVPTDLELNGDFSKSLVYNSAAGTTPQPLALLYQQYAKLSDGTLIQLPNPNFNASQAVSLSNPRFLMDFRNNLFNPNDPDPTRRGRVLVDANGVSYVSKVAQKIARDLYPRPNTDFIGNGDPNAGANYVYARRTYVTDDRYTIRLDHRIMKDQLIYGRYTSQPIFNDRYFREPIGLTDISDSADARQILLGWTGTFGPNLINEFRVGYIFGRFVRDFPSNLINRDLTSEYLNIGGAGLGIPNAIGFGSADFFAGGQPRNSSNAGGGRSWDRLGSRNPQNVGRNTEHTYSISDDLSWIRGRHILKFGAQSSLLMLNQANLGYGQLAGGRYNFGANNTQDRWCNASPFSGSVPTTICPSGTANGGDIFASFLLGIPTGLQLQSENLSAPYYYRWMNLGAYIQDDWRIRPNLTFNIGLRYQYQSPRWEKADFQGQINLNPSTFVANPFGPVPNPATGQFYSTPLPSNVTAPPAPVFELSGRNGLSRYLTDPQKLDFEPRLGFAWTPRFFGWNKDGKLVIRGGYGFTHASMMGNDREPLPIIASQTVTSSTSYGGSYFYRNPSLVTGVIDEGSPNIKDISCGLAICADPRIPMQFGYNNPIIRPDPALNIPPSSGVIRPDSTTTPTQGGTVRQDPRYRAAPFIGDPNFQTPVIQHYNLTAQYEVMKSTVVTVNYAGSRGTHLVGPMYALNVENPFVGYASKSIPGFSARYGTGIYVINPTNRASTYHAGSVDLERRFSKGLQFRFNYTYSKSVDDASGGVTATTVNLAGDVSGFQVPIRRNQNVYNSRSERAVSSYDTPHVFNLVTLVELPFGQNKRWLTQPGFMNAIVGDWQMSFLARSRSGYPVSVGLGSSNSYDMGTFQGSMRPDIILGVPLRNPDWTPENAATTSYVNPRAFAWPEPGIPGNAARNLSQLRLPWVNTLDGGVTKRFRPFKQESRLIEFRAEFFNLFNHRALSQEGVGGDILTGSQNPLITAADVAIPGVQNRFANLRAQGVWDALIARANGVATATAIANLPGTGGALGVCNTTADPGGVTTPVPGVPGASTTRGSFSPACVASQLNLNGSFYRLQMNGVNARTVQFALKLYF